VTRQKIQSVLRKAGIPAGKWIASGQIRGWGEWTEGTKVRDGDGGFTIEWVGRYVPETTQRQRLAQIMATLRAAGIECQDRPDDLGLYVFVPASQPAPAQPEGSVKG
jgi:hypothetical protein